MHRLGRLTWPLGLGSVASSLREYAVTAIAPFDIPNLVPDFEAVKSGNIWINIHKLVETDPAYARLLTAIFAGLRSSELRHFDLSEPPQTPRIQKPSPA